MCLGAFDFSMNGDSVAFTRWQDTPSLPYAPGWERGRPKIELWYCGSWVSGHNWSWNCVCVRCNAKCFWSMLKVETHGSNSRNMEPIHVSSSLNEIEQNNIQHKATKQQSKTTTKQRSKITINKQIQWCGWLQICCVMVVVAIVGMLALLCCCVLHVLPLLLAPCSDSNGTPWILSWVDRALVQGIHKQCVSHREDPHSHTPQYRSNGCLFNINVIYTKVWIKEVLSHGYIRGLWDRRIGHLFIGIHKYIPNWVS